MPPTTAATLATSMGKRRIHYRIFGHAHRAAYERTINTTLAEYNSFFTYPTSTPSAQLVPTPHVESTASGAFLPGQLTTGEQAPTGILAQQLPPTIPNERPGGNVLVAVAVAIVVMGSLVGVIAAGEIMKRRKRRPDTTEGSNKDETNLAQDKGKEVFDGKSLDSSISSLQNSPTSTDSLALHSKHATRPVQRTIPFWFSRIFRKAETGLHRRNAESPTEKSHASHIPADRSAELPQRTTWSDFSYTLEPESLSYPRPLLHCILEECEDDCQSQSGSEIALTLGLAIQRSLDSIAITSSVHGASRARSFASLRKAAKVSSIVEERYGEDRGGAPDVGIPGSVSTGMSVCPSGLELVPTASLQTLDTVASADRESLREEIFELRRVQTRSMQMDKPILLSLGFKEAGDEEETDEDDKPFDTETEHAPSDSTMTPSTANLLLPPGCDTSLRPDLRDLLGSQMTLATLASSYSAVDLDDFPLPPSIVLPRP
ncbi:hypothetical protein BD769DRAFT_1413179 [Suillus cothurnatus]|nr:hypothetical protein BD769DRAFT_1413179 [Suillus cothurnatus]